VRKRAWNNKILIFNPPPLRGYKTDNNMEKILLKDKSDIAAAVDFFGTDNRVAIKAAIKSYPCVLIGHYSDDIEFGDGYEFTTVSLDEFKGESGKKYF
jgi:hypothetical protein